MDSDNRELAGIVDRGAAAAEGNALLAALVDGGVFVPVDDASSVVFLKGSDGAPVLPGYTSAQTCLEALPQARPVHCDGARLLDIAAHTGVQRVMVATENQWAAVPMALVARVLNDRGLQTRGEQTVRLTRSVLPTAIALRDALARRILEFPGITTVWIAAARWNETGLDQLMLHLAVEAGTDPQVRERLMEVLLRQEVAPGEGDPQISVRVLDPVAEAPFVAQLDSLGLDTVRADHGTGRVEVVSVDCEGGLGEPGLPAE